MGPHDIEDILAILHTLKKLSDKDATSVGLLKKMNTLHFFSALYVVKSVLPIVSALSVAFQRGYLHFSMLGSLVLEAMTVFDPLLILQRGSCTFTAHGTQQVKILSGNFHPGDCSVQESILAEWGGGVEI